MAIPSTDCCLDLALLTILDLLKKNIVLNFESLINAICTKKLYYDKSFMMPVSTIFKNVKKIKNTCFKLKLRACIYKVMYNTIVPRKKSIIIIKLLTKYCSIDGC